MMLGMRERQPDLEEHLGVRHAGRLAELDELRGVMRMPSEVRRIAGGIATINVAASAVAGPKPSSAIAGSR